MKSAVSSSTVQNQAGAIALVVALVGFVRAIKPDLIPWEASEDETLLNNAVVATAALGALSVFFSRIFALIRNRGKAVTKVTLPYAGQTEENKAAVSAFVARVREEAAAIRAAQKKG